MMQMWPSKWNNSAAKEDKLLPDIGASPTGGAGANNGSSPYSLPSFVPDHQVQQQQGQGNPGAGGNFNGAVTSSDPLYDTISTMTQAQSTSIYTPPLGTSLGTFHVHIERPMLFFSS